MHQRTTHLPSGRFSRKHLYRAVASHGVQRRNSALQVIARTGDQTDAVFYAAVDAIDYDTHQPTIVASIVLVTVEHLPDGNWVTVTRYTEDECPAAATCPAHILALLGQPRTDQAQVWRARCEHFVRGLLPTPVRGLAAAA